MSRPICPVCQTYLNNGPCMFAAEHEEKRRALALEPDAIRAWLKRQAESGGDYGGTCEYDHNTADALVEALLAEFGRIPRTEMGQADLTAVCTRCRRAVPVGRSPNSIVNAAIYCIREDCA